MTTKLTIRQMLYNWFHIKIERLLCQHDWEYSDAKFVKRVYNPIANGFDGDYYRKYTKTASCKICGMKQDVCWRERC